MKKGFTLVELLVVIAIIGILVTVGLTSFRSSQARGRDTERKSDLKQIASALELFYADYGKYPSDNGAGLIMGCPFTTGTSTVCTWGESTFSDNKTTYFKVLPKDPSGTAYYYRSISVDSSANQGFQLFARLENSQDQNCLGGNCSMSPVSYMCGSEVCNFAVTSPNVKPTD